MEKEIFRDIQGFEGLYQVSNTGKVKSLGNGKTYNSKERILKPFKNRDGYLIISLCKDGKRKKFQVQRLVAKAFIDNPNNFPCVNHKDENKENNCVENLEWCDRKYNANYGTAIKRSAEKRYKKVICVENGIIYHSIKEAKKQTGINSLHISSCCNGKRKTTGGFHWKYV